MKSKIILLLTSLLIIPSFAAQQNNLDIENGNTAEYSNEASVVVFGKVEVGTDSSNNSLFITNSIVTSDSLDIGSKKDSNMNTASLASYTSWTNNNGNVQIGKFGNGNSLTLLNNSSLKAEGITVGHNANTPGTGNYIEVNNSTITANSISIENDNELILEAASITSDIDILGQLTVIEGSQSSLITGDLVLGGNAEVFAEFATTSLTSSSDSILAVTGNVTIGGDLFLIPDTITTIELNDIVQLFSVSGTITGEFDSISTWGDDNGWDTTHLNTDGYIIAIPEPVSISLVILSCGALVCGRRLFI